MVLIFSHKFNKSTSNVIDWLFYNKIDYIRVDDDLKIKNICFTESGVLKGKRFLCVFLLLIPQLLFGTNKERTIVNQYTFGLFKAAGIAYLSDNRIKSEAHFRLHFLTAYRAINTTPNLDLIEYNLTLNKL